MILARIAARPAHPTSSGTITKTLQIAINDCDAGRLSKKHLLEVFQEAIDNGDILEPDNELAVVGAVLPLVDNGALQPSEHLKAFEGRMNQKATDFVAERRTAKTSGCLGLLVFVAVLSVLAEWLV